jgi:hypothetical protein
MVQRIPCPNCRQAIYFPEAQESEAVCVNCNNLYILSLGTLEHLSVRVDGKDDLRQVKGGSKRNPRIYDIRFSGAVGYQAFQLQVHNHRIRIEALPGDEVAMLYFGSRGHPPTLAWLKNLTTGVEYQLRSPNQDARTMGRKAGSLVFLFALAASLAVGGVPARILQLISLPTAFSTGYVVHRKYRNHLRGSSKNQFLWMEQPLLGRLDELEQKLENGQSVYQSTQSLIQRLAKHQQKMRDLDANRYREQLDLVDRGTVILQRQLDVSRYLVKQYSQAIALLEVEIETGRLAEQLPDGEAISQRRWDELDELADLEQQLLVLDQELSSSGIRGVNLDGFINA